MSGGLHSLATIIKRLEATTSRLEDVSSAWDNVMLRHGAGGISGDPAAIPAAAAPAPTSSHSTSHTSLPVAEEPQSLVAFDKVVLEEKVQPFLALTKSFAIPPVIEQADLFYTELRDLRSLLATAAACQQPNQKDFGDLLAPLQADIEAIARLKKTNSEWSNHMMLLSEGAPSVGWVTVPKPGPHVKEIHDIVMFYGHRIMKEFKERDAKHAQWVTAYTSILEAMRLWIMEYHPTGLVWNPNGVAVAQHKASTASAVSAGAAPPPPPPPPPPGPLPSVAPSSAPAAGGVAAVFADLNRGEEVTKGLRKVDKSEMTHKNPALRAGSAVPSQAGSNPAAGKKPLKPMKPQSLMARKPSKFALEGNKWVIEYQENETNLVVETAEMGHTVSLYGCKNSTVMIKGKVNAVTLANCQKTSVLVESVVSSISVTNSTSFAVQITGSAPTIQLDSVDSGQLFLSKSCLGVEIITAKCSSINVSLPVEGEEDGIFAEAPLPEMLKTTISNGKLVTTVVEHVG